MTGQAVKYRVFSDEDILAGHELERIMQCEDCHHILTPGEQRPSATTGIVECPICHSQLVRTRLYDSEYGDVTCWPLC